MPSHLPRTMIDDQRESVKRVLSPSADYVIAGASMSEDMKEMSDLVLDGSTDAAKLQSLIDELGGVGKILILGEFNSEKAITYASPYLHIAGWGGLSKITAGAAHDVFSFSGAGSVFFSNIEMDGNTTGTKGIETTAAGVIVNIRDCKIHSHATNDVDINGTTYDDVFNLSSEGTYSRFEYEGAITGDVTGDLIGDVLATDLTKVLENGTNGADSTYTGTVTGSSSKVLNGTPVNAAYAIGLLTVSGVVIDTETVTIDGRVYEFDTDATSTGDVAVDISASAVAATGILTIAGVVIDTETMTIGVQVYEFDSDDTPHVGVNTRVDISESAGYSTRSEGTITFANGDIHDDTVVINGVTHTLKTDGTADSATVCDITGAASIVAATGVFGLGGPVADTETITINARVYEFDSGGGIGGDVAIDVSGGLGIDNALTELVVAINGDGAAVVTASAYTPGDNEVTLTSKIAGLVGNYVVSETCANGGWQLGQGAAGNLTDGADATALEIGVIFDAHMNAAGLQADIVSNIGGTDNLVVITWAKGGVAGDAITFTETLTAGSVDGGGVLGATTAGVDCVQADAVTAIATSVTANDTQGVGAVDGAGDTVDLTADVPGVAGNALATTETMAQGSFAQVTLTGGSDCTAANAITALVASINGDGSAVVTAYDGVGDTMYVYADVMGTVGNALTTVEGMANGAWGAGVLAGGVNGTVGAQWDRFLDGDYYYVAKATNTIADDNWYKVPLTIGGKKRRITAVGADYYTVPTDDMIACTAGSISINLMSNAFETDEVKTIMDRDGSATATNITIVAETGTTINGAASILLATNYDSVDIIKMADGDFRVV